MTARESVHVKGANFAARDVYQGEHFEILKGPVADESRIPTQYDLCWMPDEWTQPCGTPDGGGDGKTTSALALTWGSESWLSLAHSSKAYGLRLLWPTCRPLQ